MGISMSVICGHVQIVDMRSGLIHQRAPWMLSSKGDTAKHEEELLQQRRKKMNRIWNYILNKMGYMKKEDHERAIKFVRQSYNYSFIRGAHHGSSIDNMRNTLSSALGVLGTAIYVDSIEHDMLVAVIVCESVKDCGDIALDIDERAKNVLPVGVGMRVYLMEPTGMSFNVF